MAETSSNQDQDLRSRYVKITIVVSSFWVVSITTVFVNKALLSSKDAPLFIAWFQCLLSFAICYLFSLTGGVPRLFKFPEGTPWSVDSMKKVLPLTILFILLLATNNLCLQNVGLSFYNVVRSLTTVFNVLFSWIIFKEITSARCLLCCAFIIFGFTLGVDQEQLILGSLPWKGTLYGISGSMILSLYSIYTKKVLPIINQEVWLLAYYSNAYASILFLPFILINGEQKQLLVYTELDSYFWILMLFGGVCEIANGVLISFQIKVTSPLTHIISGTAKSCVQTILAAQWYNEKKNILWWTSNFIVLASSAVYAWLKQIEMDKKQKTSVPKTEAEAEKA